MHGLVRYLQTTFTSGGLQIAGGINATNSRRWIELGANKIVVTSYLFPDGNFSLARLIELENLVGKDRLIIDVRYAL